MSDDTDVFYTIRQELFEKGWLDDNFIEFKDMVASIETMINKNNYPEAAVYIKTNYPRYVQMMKDSLTLKKYNGNLVDKETHYELTLKMKSPMVMVITMGE